MPRSRSNDTFKSRKDGMTSVDSDPSVLIQTFDKPTQIYRYLKTLSINSPPLLLHRNLSYMKGRCTRKNQKRNEFKVDSMLEKVQKVKHKDKDGLTSNENLIIAFVRFDDELLNAKSVRVETKLEKISHKRRKEGISDTLPKRIGESIVVVNTDDNGTEKLPAVCVAKNEFDANGENLNTTYQLTFDIESQTPYGSASRKERDGDEPPNKIHCSRKTYHAELPVFDKSGKNLLSNGLYQVTALEPHIRRSSRTTYWESLETDQRIANWAEEVNKHYPADDDMNPFIAFDKTPKIQLYMEWKQELIVGNNYITRPKFINDQHNNNKENTSTINIPTTNGVNGQHSSNEIMKSEPTPKSYIFQFVVSNSIKQRTAERTDFICPWCSVNCMRLYSLLKHLKLCHARFLFQFVEENPIRRIDVYVNELYDGSYGGAPHDVLIGSQRGPTRRTVVTNIMVFRPRKPTFKMSEFQEADDGELDQQRQYISGHNRIYYHSETCIPIMPKELDYDSEGEPDPKWLQRTTKQMIDEFTDVNGGEKELMKLWNLHVMKHGFVGDCQINLACDLFLKEKGKEIVQKNLFRNYINHLHSLFNYGLISPRTIENNLLKLLDIQKTATTTETIKKNRTVTVESWMSRTDKPSEKEMKIETPSKTTSSSTKVRSGKKCHDQHQNSSQSTPKKR